MQNEKLLPPWFRKGWNPDSEPAEVTAGETDFFFGHNASNLRDESEDEWQSLLASEPCQMERQSQIKKGNTNPMITLSANNVPATTPAPKGVQFLKPIHVSKDGTVAEIYRVTTDKPDKFQNPYVVYFAFGGQKYSKGFKGTSDNLAALVGILGNDEKKWIKKTVVITRETDGEGAERISFSKD